MEKRARYPRVTGRKKSSRPSGTYLDHLCYIELHFAQVERILALRTCSWARTWITWQNRVTLSYIALTNASGCGRKIPVHPSGLKPLEHHVKQSYIFI